MPDITTEIDGPVKPKKPGYKTSEFYLTLAAQIVGLMWASGLISEGTTFDKVLGFVAMALGLAGYTVSRGLAKK